VLGTHELLLFLARPEALVAPAAEARALALLDDAERARLARFHFERDRRVALASRALQRRALSQVTGIAADALAFVTTAHGRPELGRPEGTDVRFNVSNTIGLVVCAVTRSREIGVDVEPERSDAPVEIVESHFAPVERRALLALPEAARPERFVILWTLKEAYLKARGVGLGLPLDRFWFHVDGDDSPRLEIGPELGDRPERWQVQSFGLAGADGRPGHRLGLCVERRPGEAALVPRFEPGPSPISAGAR
jgi:4'-phosphopantetheinyl transferase